MAEEKPRVLVVRAEASDAPAFEETLARSGYETEVAPLGADGLAAVESFEPHVTVVDLRGGGPSDRFIENARLRREGMKVVGIAEPAETVDTRHDSFGTDSIVRADQTDTQLVPLVDRAAEQARSAERAENFRRRAEEVLSLARFDAIIGNHPSMQELLKRVAYVAGTRATILIHGESGTGKELIAAALHQNSKRRNGPFVRLNCSALAESLLESELFGHEKGAFSGAVTRREGRFLQADQGTLFLDEISEVPLPLQVKLLRFLQEREFERVGGNQTLRVDTRIVAASNRDLRALVEDGRFREDLYYRLAVVTLDVPPLRARPSDILLLADQFLRKAAQENEVDVVGFTDAARQALLDYPWPGNVRELQNVVEQAVVLTDRQTIDAHLIPASSRRAADGMRLMIPGATLEEIERYAICETLRAVDGSPTKAAKILGVSRRTIQYRLKEWGGQSRSSDD